MRQRSIIRSCIILLVGFCAVALQHPAFAQSDLFASINGNSSNGTGFINEYANEGSAVTAVSGLDRPRGVGFDSSGNLYVLTNTSGMGEFNGTLTEYTGNGSPTTIYTDTTGNFFESLAVTGSGDVYVVGGNVTQDPTDPATVATIWKFSGGTRSVIGTVPGQGFGIARDVAGNLYVADPTSQTIYKFDTIGTRTIFAGPSAFAATGGPVGLAFNSVGNLFASTSGGTNGASILKFDAAGVATAFASDLTGNPRGLAFDGAGNLFVGETGATTSGDILEFTPGGVASVFDSGLGRASGNGGAEYLAFAPQGTEPVPEPGTWIGSVLVSGSLAFSFLRRNRSMRKSGAGNGSSV